MSPTSRILPKWEGVLEESAHRNRPRLRRRLLIAWLDLTGWVTATMLALSFGFALCLLGLVIYEQFNGYHNHAVLSGSMTPYMPVGSLILTRNVAASQLRVGDVVSFHPPGQQDVVITHRIVQEITELPPPSGTGQRYFLTKGDANPVRDPWRVQVTGSFEKTQAVIPYAGYIAVAMQSRAARLGLLIGPALLLSIILLIEVWQPRRRRL